MEIGFNCCLAPDIGHHIGAQPLLHGAEMVPIGNVSTCSLAGLRAVDQPRPLTLYFTDWLCMQPLSGGIKIRPVRLMAICAVFNPSASDGIYFEPTDFIFCRQLLEITPKIEGLHYKQL